MDRDSLEAWLVEGRSLEEIGRLVGRHPSTVGYWVRKHGLKPSGSATHRARGALTADRLRPLVEQGLSVREIAREVDRSPSTVRHWLARHRLRVLRGGAPAERPVARHAIRNCITHGRVTFVLEGRGYYRCGRCRAANVGRRRQRVKEILVAEAGGACAICGYERYAGALQFHHCDPSEKDFGLSVRGVTRSIGRLRAEARKCILLCANCHAEVEAGIAALPSRPAAHSGVADG